MNKLRLLSISLILFHLVEAQLPAYNFRHLTTSDGLSDGAVHAIVQDKFGFIWIGTSYGLNRFDGVNIKTFFANRKDSNALLDNYIQTLFCDKKGELWIGGLTTLLKYDYSTGKFRYFKAAKELTIKDIEQDPKGNIWVATGDGLWIADEQHSTLNKFSGNGNPALSKFLQGNVVKIVPHDGNWYLATNQGIKIFNPLTLAYDQIKHDSTKPMSLSNDAVVTLSFDANGYLWAVCTSSGSILNKVDLVNHHNTLYQHFIDPKKGWTNNSIKDIFSDTRGRLWVTSTTAGLSLYDASNDDFLDYSNNPVFPTGDLGSGGLGIFQDGSGIMWLGSEGYGLSYFNPDRNLFYNIHPIFKQTKPSPELWCRAACEDKAGNWWLGTAQGLARYNPSTQSFTYFENAEQEKPVIYYNSIRSLMEDDDGDIWIGTAKGLNKFHTATGTIEFYTEKQGISQAFFWMMAKDSKSEVWIGAREGLYHYLRKGNKFDDLSKDPLLSICSHRNIQALYADKFDRLWIGVLDLGLVEYDIPTQKIKILTIKDSLIRDTRFSAFALDHHGILWIGSEEGLTAYDPAKNTSKFFTRASGLPSHRTNNLMVDTLDRLWVGTSNGLCMFNESRDSIKRFGIVDGMLNSQFNEQSACSTRNGLFIYPTYNGFLVFSPAKYQQGLSPLPLYITSFKTPKQEWGTGYNSEEIKSIDLGHDENFFSIDLAGLNYLNPQQCTYAYRLEPFDKDWIYTKKREINYTNVPAGDYTFRYKAITDDPGIIAHEKTVAITIAAIFYRTWWFQLMVAILLALILYGIYIYRLRHREKLLILKAKTQILEKEKALVMYESLKQQLNPHFLFNSLTSLGSLIQTDQKLARQFLDQMSKIYRYILKSRDIELVPLQEEIKLVEVYVQLQQTRFQEGLKLCIEVGEEYADRKIVPVTLQNLVENAIKHNIIDKETPLVVEIYPTQDYLVVRNNMQKKSFVETSNKQGLLSMRSLYRYLTSKQVVITEADNYFTVKIPLI